MLLSHRAPRLDVVIGLVPRCLGSDASKNLIKLARKVLGDSIDIHADSNSSYDPSQAIEVGRMLEEINAVYFEEPCPFDQLKKKKLELFYYS